MVQVEPLLQFSPLCCLHFSIYNMGRLVILINIVLMMKMVMKMTVLPSSILILSMVFLVIIALFAAIVAIIASLPVRTTMSQIMR